MSEAVELIKDIALNAVTAEKPLQVVFGLVVSDYPLQIQTEQKIILPDDVLILTSNVRDTYADAEISYYIDSHHNNGTKKVLLHKALERGEQVIMLRIQGGQQYIVLDRTGEQETYGEWF